MITLFKLLIAHAVTDFALQSDTMARGKNRNYKTEPPPNARYFPCWPYWLTAHALVSAGGVGIATGRWDLALAECCIHWIADFLKCDNITTVPIDQAIHIGSKILWWLLAIEVTP